MIRGIAPSPRYQWTTISGSPHAPAHGPRANDQPSTATTMPMVTSKRSSERATLARPWPRRMRRRNERQMMPHFGRSKRRRAAPATRWMSKRTVVRALLANRPRMPLPPRTASVSRRSALIARSVKRWRRRTSGLAFRAMLGGIDRTIVHDGPGLPSGGGLALSVVRLLCAAD